MIAALTLLVTLVAPGLAGAQEPAPGNNYTIATDITFAPFEFQDESGKLVGIDMDLLAAIAEDQGFTYQVNPSDSTPRSRRSRAVRPTA